MDSDDDMTCEWIGEVCAPSAKADPSLLQKKAERKGQTTLQVARISQGFSDVVQSDLLDVRGRYRDRSAATAKKMITEAKLLVAKNASDPKAWAMLADANLGMYSQVMPFTHYMDQAMKALNNSIQRAVNATTQDHKLLESLFSMLVHTHAHTVSPLQDCKQAVHMVTTAQPAYKGCMDALWAEWSSKVARVAQAVRTKAGNKPKQIAKYIKTMKSDKKIANRVVKAIDELKPGLNKSSMVILYVLKRVDMLPAALSPCHGQEPPSFPSAEHKSNATQSWTEKFPALMGYASPSFYVCMDRRGVVCVVTMLNVKCAKKPPVRAHDPLVVCDPLTAQYTLGTPDSTAQPLTVTMVRADNPNFCTVRYKPLQSDLVAKPIV